MRRSMLAALGLLVGAQLSTAPRADASPNDAAAPRPDASAPARQDGCVPGALRREARVSRAVWSSAGDVRFCLEPNDGTSGSVCLALDPATRAFRAVRPQEVVAASSPPRYGLDLGPGTASADGRALRVCSAPSQCVEIVPRALPGDRLELRDEALRFVRSPDGAYAVFFSVREGGPEELPTTLLVHDARTGRRIRAIRYRNGHNGDASVGVRFLGRWLVAWQCDMGPYCTGHYLDPRTGRVLARIPDNLLGLSYFPGRDGHVVAAFCGASTLAVVDPARRAAVGTIPLPLYSTCEYPAFDAVRGDGRVAFVASANAADAVPQGMGAGDVAVLDPARPDAPPAVFRPTTCPSR